MNSHKWLLLVLITLAVVIFVGIFVNEFVRNQNSSEYTKLNDDSMASPGTIKDESMLNFEEQDPRSADVDSNPPAAAADLEADIESLDFSGLDEGLNELETEATGL